MTEVEQEVLNQFIKDDVSELFYAMVYGAEPSERHRHAIEFMLAFRKSVLGKDGENATINKGQNNE